MEGWLLVFPRVVQYHILYQAWHTGPTAQLGHPYQWLYAASKGLSQTSNNTSQCGQPQWVAPAGCAVQLGFTPMVCTPRCCAAICRV